MDLRHEFEVGVPITEAWRILTDVERIAPCLPGAQLTEVEGDVYRGQVKVKVGPILAQFKGQASFVSRDEDAYTATLKGEGRDTGGKGNASALITASLQSVDASRTKCVVTTDLTISGKVAQFGRGALADVSDKLLAQFTENLNSLIASSPTEAASTPVGAAPAETITGVRQIESADVAPLDLLEAAGSTIAKRLVPLVVVIAVVAVVIGVVVF
jgi:carbon monoxide dehydrogenase subunit G